MTVDLPALTARLMLDRGSTRRPQRAVVDIAERACEHRLMNAASASDVQISVLGGVRVEIGVGDPVDPLPRKCQELLAALALDPGAAIPVARLVTLMWGDNPPRTAEKTMQTYVARLRRELGADAIARIGAAYRLDVDPASIDATRFRAALKAGQIDAALSEWGGPTRSCPQGHR